MFAIPKIISLENKAVKILPLSINHTDELFNISIDDGENIFYHMFFGPFINKNEVEQHITNFLKKPNTKNFVIYSLRMKKIVGCASISDINTTHGSAELSNIWYMKTAQKTEVNTNTIYLLLSHLFDKLGYRRVFWKCDVLNNKSKKAATRLGFKAEGIFKKHMIIKGRNRDTAWFAITFDNWQQVKTNLKSKLVFQA